jgi:integrase
VATAAFRLVGPSTTSRRATPTFTDYVEKWLALCESRGLRAATVASYWTMVRLHIDSSFGSTRLDAITPRLLNELYGRLLASGRKSGGGLSARSVRYLHAILRKSFADAVRLGYLEANPASAADPPSARAARAPIFRTCSPAELARFLTSARGNPLYAAFHLAAATGMRRGEALGTRWCDVDSEARQVRVVQTVIEVGHVLTVAPPKSDRGRRVIALDDRTLSVLRDHRERTEASSEQSPLGSNRLFFARPDGSPLHPACFSYAFNQAVKVAGVPRIRFHDLRHSHATMALQAGIHPKIVSGRLGHSTVAITLDVYTHAIPSLQRDAADAIAGLIPL